MIINQLTVLSFVIKIIFNRYYFVCLSSMVLLQ